MVSTPKLSIKKPKRFGKKHKRSIKKHNRSGKRPKRFVRVIRGLIPSARYCVRALGRLKKRIKKIITV